MLIFLRIKSLSIVRVITDRINGCRTTEIDQGGKCRVVALGAYGETKHTPSEQSQNRYRGEQRLKDRALNRSSSRMNPLLRK